jgi:3-oxoacyl-[acyl-carrier protein] reductase
LNVVSTVTAILACKTLLLETEGSSIINIGSSTASEPGEFNPHYAAAKAALSNLSKSLANYFGTKGVRVNEIRVGPVVTHSWDVLIEQTMDTVRKTKEVNFQEISLKIVKSIPIGRLGEPADVAKIVKFLASMDSSWITGSIIDLDGGKSRGY